MKKYILIFLMLTILTPSVHPIGIAGADLNMDMDFEPGLQKDLRYTLLTTSSITQDYELYAQGELNGSIILETKALKDVAPGETPTINAKLALPKEMAEPGIHKVRICVKETMSENPGQVSALSAACATINIRVLYPGKKVKIKLNTNDANVHEPVNFEIKVENWGKEDINKAKAKIEISDILNQNIKTIDTNQASIKSSESATLRATLDTIGWAPGRYDAKAIVNYDGETQEDKSSFKIGIQSVRIINHTSIFPKDKISPFDLFIESEWNDPIANVYAELKVNNKIMKTPSANLKPWSTGKLTAYWDTTGLEIGDYDAEVILHYTNKETNKKVILQIKDVEKTQTRFAMSITMTVITLIITLAIINLLWFMYLNKRYKTK